MKKINFNFSLFFKEASLFVLTLALGLFVAWRYSLVVSTQFSRTLNGGFSLADGVVLVFGLIMIFVVQQNKTISKWFYRIFLFIFIFTGIEVVSDALIKYHIGFYVAIVGTLLFYYLRFVLVHDLGMAIGLAAMGAVIGMALGPKIAIMALVVLSFYDIFAVYKTRHMITMARSMIAGGSIFGFVIPFSWKDFLAKSSLVKDSVGEKFMILGSGDVGLPLILAASVVPVSLLAGIIIATFSLIGLFVTHMLFINQPNKEPMAALPPIATFAILGYLFSLFFL